MSTRPSTRVLETSNNGDGQKQTTEQQYLQQSLGELQQWLAQRNLALRAIPQVVSQGELLTIGASIQLVRVTPRTESSDQG